MNIWLLLVLRPVWQILLLQNLSRNSLHKVFTVSLCTHFYSSNVSAPISKQTRTNSGTGRADDEDLADQDVTEGIGGNKVFLEQTIYYLCMDDI